MQKVEVWLIRHGETDWNAERRLQGHTDIPLNAIGEAQALTLQPELARLNPQVILTSDLSRALKTAEIANSILNLPMSIHPELRESILGEPEGRTIEEVISHYGEESWQRWGTDLDFAYPGGEMPRQTIVRVHQFLLGFFASRLELNKVAVFTHGGVVRRMVGHAHYKAPDAVPFLRNCSINHMQYDRVEHHWTFIGPVAACSNL